MWWIKKIKMFLNSKAIWILTGIKPKYKIKFKQVKMKSCINDTNVCKNLLNLKKFNYIKNNRKNK